MKLRWLCLVPLLICCMAAQSPVPVFFKSGLPPFPYTPYMSVSLSGDTSAVSGYVPSTSTTAYDSGTASNNLVLSGTQAGSHYWYDVAYNSLPYKWHLNGTNDSAVTSNAMGAPSTAIVGIGAWLTTPSVSSISVNMVAELSSNFNSCASVCYGITFNENSIGSFNIVMHSSTGYSIRYTNSRYDGGTHFLFIVMDLTQATWAAQVTVYVDGIAVPVTLYGAYNNVLSGNFASGQKLYLGARSSSSLYLLGNMNGFLVYYFTIAPTAPQVLNLCKRTEGSLGVC